MPEQEIYIRDERQWSNYIPLLLTPLLPSHPQAFPWQALVLDEAHGLKNAGSQRFQHIMSLKVSRTLPTRGLSFAITALRLAAAYLYLLLIILLLTRLTKYFLSICRPKSGCC